MWPLVQVAVLNIETRVTELKLYTIDRGDDSTDALNIITMVSPTMPHAPMCPYAQHEPSTASSEAAAAVQSVNVTTYHAQRHILERLAEPTHRQPPACFALAPPVDHEEKSRSCCSARRTAG